MRALLFYTIGYPGAGKTTLASRLSVWLGAEHLRGDKIGLELFKCPTFSQQERQTVYSEMARRASRQLASGRHVIYDAATNSLAQRQQLRELARQYDSPAIGLWVDVPTSLARKRAGTVRDQGLAGTVVRVIPPNIFAQYVAMFEPPQDGELVITVAGDKSFPEQYRQLCRHVKGPVLPRLVQ